MSRLEVLARSAVKSLAHILDSRYVRPGPRILIYHQVNAGLGREMEVTLAAFEAQMTHLSESERVVRLEDALASPSERSVVITFDDGYRDTFETAFPILRALDLPFTLYLATESIETGSPIGPTTGADPLSWRQVEAMTDQADVTIGAHTHTHRDLRGLDQSIVAHELETSDALIESRLGQRPRHFAYPWGYWSQTADALVASRYDSAVLGGGQPVSERSGFHRLNRVPIQLSDGVAGFHRKLVHGGRSEERIRRLLKGYRGP